MKPQTRTLLGDELRHAWFEELGTAEAEDIAEEVMMMIEERAREGELSFEDLVAAVIKQMRHRE